MILFYENTQLIFAEVKRAFLFRFVSVKVNCFTDSLVMYSKKINVQC